MRSSTLRTPRRANVVAIATLDCANTSFRRDGGKSNNARDAWKKMPLGTTPPDR